MLFTVSHEADTNQNHSGTPLLTHQHSYINSFFKKKKIKLEGKMEGEKRGEREEKGGRGKKEEGREESFRLTILVTF